MVRVLRLLATFLAAAKPALTVTLLLLAVQLPYSRHISDDYVHLSILEGKVEGFGSAPFDLYAFVTGPEAARRNVERGPLPWFTSPNTRIRFFRPLSSALLTAEHAVFGRWAPGYRLTAAAWYLALVALHAALLDAGGRFGLGGLRGLVGPLVPDLT